MENGQREGESTLEYVQRIIREGAERNEAAHREFLERERAAQERNEAEHREFKDGLRAFEKTMEFLRERSVTHEMEMAEIREQHYRTVAANNQARDEFQAEHGRLLTSQVLMNEALQKMARAAEILDVKMAETTDKLNALIDFVQSQRKNGSPPAQ